MSEEETPEEEAQEKEYTKRDFLRYYLTRLLSKLDRNEDIGSEDYRILASAALDLMHDPPKEDRIKEMRVLGWYPTFLTTEHGFGWIRNDTIVPDHIKLIKEHLGQDSPFKRDRPKDLEEYLIRLAIIPNPFERIMEGDLSSQKKHIQKGLKELAYYDQVQPEEGECNDPHFFAHEEFNQLQIQIEESRFKKERGSGESYIFIPSIPWESELHKQSPFLHSVFLQIDNPYKSNKAWLSMGEDEEIKDKTLWTCVMKVLGQKLKAVLKTS